MNVRNSILASVWAALVFAGAGHAGTDECPKGDFVVAIDIGHSKAIPGTRSARGRHEYEFNVEMAELLETRLRETGFDRSFVIEHGDTAPSFEERAAAAGEADLLLSIHHDSVQPRYLKTWTVDGVELDYTDAFHGYSVFISRRNGNAAESEHFGRLLGLSMLRHGFTPTLHHAEPITGENRELADEKSGVYYFDDLLILHTPEVPAVLLECGVIKNRQEELFLQSPRFRARMLDAIVFAVDSYCATEMRLTPGSEGTNIPRAGIPATEAGKASSGPGLLSEAPVPPAGL